MKKIIFVILLCWFPSIVMGSMDTASSIRIVGGEKAPPGAYPWAAALFHADTSDPFSAQFCGGSLIRADIVLTAAHCVADIDLTELDVTVGANSLNAITPDQRISVASIMIHPAYVVADSPDNDIALIRLSRAVPNPTLTLVTTAIMDEVVFGNQEMTVLGWGALTGSGSPFFPQSLQHVSVPYVDSRVCNAALDNSVTENMFCAGFSVGGKDSCQGDSGGPMIYVDAANVVHQVGIVSWGEGDCAQQDKYGVYTKVLNYLSWAKDMMDGLHLPEALDVGYIGQGQSVSVEIDIYWGGTSTVNAVSVLGTDVLQGDFITISGDTCSQLLPSDSCSLVLDMAPELAGLVDGRVSIRFSNGQTKRVDILGQVLPPIDANEFLGTINWSWFSGGSAPWELTHYSRRTGYQSGVIADNQSSVILTYVEGPGTLAFDWKVSSEAYYDFVDVYVGNRPIVGVSGEQTWQRRSIAIEDGHQAISWRYAKDDRGSDGGDRAGVDNVTWTPTPSNNNNGGGGFSLWLLLLSCLGGYRCYCLKRCV